MHLILNSFWGWISFIISVPYKNFFLSCVKKSLVVFSVENHNKTNLVVKHSLKRADEEEAEEGKIFSPKVGEALTECPAGPSSCQH